MHSALITLTILIVALIVVVYYMVREDRKETKHTTLSDKYSGEIWSRNKQYSQLKNLTK